MNDIKQSANRRDTQKVERGYSKKRGSYRQVHLPPVHYYPSIKQKTSMACGGRLFSPQKCLTQLKMHSSQPESKNKIQLIINPLICHVIY